MGGAPSPARRRSRPPLPPLASARAAASWRRRSTRLGLHAPPLFLTGSARPPRVLLGSAPPPPLPGSSTPACAARRRPARRRASLRPGPDATAGSKLPPGPPTPPVSPRPLHHGPRILTASMAPPPPTGPAGPVHPAPPGAAERPVPPRLLGSGSVLPYSAARPAAAATGLLP